MMNGRMSADGKESLAEYLEGFFRRYPAIKRHAPSKIVEMAPRGGHHPEAQQSGNEVWVYPKFWQVKSKESRDFILAHEIGHYVLSRMGLAKFIELAQTMGVDPWATDALPFGQYNMDEAFADSFATYFVSGHELHSRYPDWEKVVERVKTARAIRLDKGRIQALSQELQDVIKMKTRGRNGPLGKTILVPGAPFDIRAVDGSDLSVFIRLQSVETKSPYYVVSGGSGHDKSKRPVIIINLNAGTNCEVYFKSAQGSSVIAHQMYPVLLHELTHAADKFSEGVGSTMTEQEAQGNAAYYNNPGEVRAYLQEILNEIEESRGIQVIPKLESTFGVNKGMQIFLNMSQTWKEIEPHLNERNRHLVMKAVAELFEKGREVHSASDVSHRVAHRFRKAMEVGLGEDGLDLTWQAKWEPTTKCCRCGKEARLAIAAREDGPDYATNLHPNDPKGEGFWLHDAAAFAIYLCMDIDCAAATTLWNQA